MPAVEVYDTHETAHAAAADLPEPAGGVEMLKEQQWPILLRTEAAAIREVQEHRRTTARVAPRPTHHARVPAPRGGFLERAADGGLPELGVEVKAGQVQYRTDRAGIVHCSIGKVNFEVQALKENLEALLADLNKAKPSSSKGTYVKKITVSSTMGPGVPVEKASLGV